jgi:hypothetical protein
MIFLDVLFRTKASKRNGTRSNVRKYQKLGRNGMD